ncbi:TPA: hypothetical protein ACGMN0_001104 [Streptococcus agalactiae]
MKSLKKGKFVTLYFDEEYLMIVETLKNKSRCYYLSLPASLLLTIRNNFREGSFLIADGRVSLTVYRFILSKKRSWGKVLIRSYS